MNVGIQYPNRRCDPCSLGLCNLPTLTIDEFKASWNSVLKSGFWRTVKVVYCGHAIFVSKALESSCAPNLHQCPGQPSLRLHRRPLPCTLRGADREAFCWQHSQKLGYLRADLNGTSPFSPHLPNHSLLSFYFSPPKCLWTPTSFNVLCLPIYWFSH